MVAAISKRFNSSENSCNLVSRWVQSSSKRSGEREANDREASGAAASGCSIELRWRDGGRAPCEMYGEVSVVDGSVAYFRPVGSKSVLILPTIPLITNGVNFFCVLTLVAV